MSDSHETTRLRLEVIRLQFELGCMSAENDKLRVMLDTALQTKSRAIDSIAADAIRKAASK
jgi:hypothetical protein